MGSSSAFPPLWDAILGNVSQSSALLCYAFRDPLQLQLAALLSAVLQVSSRVLLSTFCRHRQEWQRGVPPHPKRDATASSSPSRDDHWPSTPLAPTQVAFFAAQRPPVLIFAFWNTLQVGRGAVSGRGGSPRAGLIERKGTSERCSIVEPPSAVGMPAQWRRRRALRHLAELHSVILRS